MDNKGLEKIKEIINNSYFEAVFRDTVSKFNLENLSYQEMTSFDKFLKVHKYFHNELSSKLNELKVDCSIWIYESYLKHEKQLQPFTEKQKEEYYLKLQKLFLLN